MQLQFIVENHPKYIGSFANLQHWHENIPDIRGSLNRFSES